MTALAVTEMVSDYLQIRRGGLLGASKAAVERAAAERAAEAKQAEKKTR